LRRLLCESGIVGKMGMGVKVDRWSLCREVKEGNGNVEKIKPARREMRAVWHVFSLFFFFFFLFFFFG